ncbi:ATP-binding protein [Streptomyces flavalbus]|uniref:ATP-binding protein n=1 Tax=Streptomyces flavalbus TaxID=2665155 RepID=A0ABW2W7Z6_9ACTN
MQSDEHALRIEVYDTCPEPYSESGRGLFLVAALADRYGADATAIGKCPIRP